MRFTSTSPFAYLFLTALLFCCLRPNGRAAESEQSNSLTGSWELSWVRFGETNVDRLVLTQRVGQVTGRVFGGLDIEGTRKGDELELKVFNKDKKEVAALSGTPTGAGLSGILTLDSNRFDWSASKMPVRPPNAARRYEFKPTRFYNHFSGTFPPVLTVFPGDTIHTETVDAGGVDKDGVPRAAGGNPLTGPFYVAGAVRGDALVVPF